MYTHTVWTAGNMLLLQGACMCEVRRSINGAFVGIAPVDCEQGEKVVEKDGKDAVVLGRQGRAKASVCWACSMLWRRPLVTIHARGSSVTLLQQKVQHMQSSALPRRQHNSATANTGRISISLV